jgi:hypothetical protein
MKTYGEVELQLRDIFTSVTDGAEWSASHLGRFNPGNGWSVWSFRSLYGVLNDALGISDYTVSDIIERGPGIRSLSENNRSYGRDLNYGLAEYERNAIGPPQQTVQRTSLNNQLLILLYKTHRLCGQSVWLQIQRSRVRFTALPDFLRSGGSGTGSTQPRQDN